MSDSKANVVTTLVNWYVIDTKETGNQTVLTVYGAGAETKQKYTVICTKQARSLAKRLKLTRGSCITVQGAVTKSEHGESIYARTLRISGEARTSAPFLPSSELRDFNCLTAESMRIGDNVSFAARVRGDRYFIYCFDEVAGYAKKVENGDMVSFSAEPVVKVTGKDKKKVSVYWKAYFLSKEE